MINKPTKTFEDFQAKKNNSIDNLNSLNSALLFYQVITNNKLDFKKELEKVQYLFKMFSILKTAPDSYDIEKIIKLMGNITPFDIEK